MRDIKAEIYRPGIMFLCSSTEILFCFLISVFCFFRFSGNPEATPKCVLKLMNIPGLQLSHIKSHLQVGNLYIISLATEKFLEGDAYIFL